MLKFSPLVYALRCCFYCCWCCYYTTARVNAAQIFPVGVGVALPFLLLLVLLLHYGEGKCCSNLRRWCRRCVAVSTAVDAAITLRRGQTLQKFSPLVYALRCRFNCCWCCYYTTAKANAAKIFAVGIGVTLPFLLLLVLLLHGEGKRCSNFRRWCRLYIAVFTAFGGAFTLPRG